MDSRLRALKRAIVDNETAARYVAACVQAGENTRARVRIASCLNNEVAQMLENKEELEGEYGAARHEYVNIALQMLDDEERQEVRTVLLGDRYRDRPLALALSRDRNYASESEEEAAFRHYQDTLHYQMAVISAILLKLPEI